MKYFCRKKNVLKGTNKRKKMSKHFDDKDEIITTDKSIESQKYPSKNEQNFFVVIWSINDSINPKVNKCRNFLIYEKIF